MNLLLLIRVVEWASLTLSFAGELASVYGVIDSIRGLLRIPRPMREPDHVTLTWISTLSVTVGVIAHFVFGMLALLGLLTTPTPARYPFALATVVSYVVIQALMVAASVLVVVLSRRIRSNGGMA